MDVLLTDPQTKRYPSSWRQVPGSQVHTPNHPATHTRPHDGGDHSLILDEDNGLDTGGHNMRGGEPDPGGAW